MIEQVLNTPVSKRTRAVIMREKVKIRLALDETGPLIAEVLKENGIELPGMDWSKVFPHWLLATCDDDVIGVLQVMPSKPIAWCEFLYVKPSVGFKLRAIAIRKLIAAGMTTCYHAGASYVAGMVDCKNQKFYDILTKLNFVTLSPHMAMVKSMK